MARVFLDGGAQNLVSASQLLTSANTFSVAFWAYRTATPGAQRGFLGNANGSRVGASDGFYFLLETSNLITAAFCYTTTDKLRRMSTALTLNAWTHVVVTHQNQGLLSTDFSFYFNGVAEAGTNVSSGVGTHDSALANAFSVGQTTGLALSSPVNIGPVAYWGRVITPAEALALSGGAHPLCIPDFVEAWLLDGATSTSDESGQAVPLTLTQSGSPAAFVGPLISPRFSHAKERPVFAWPAPSAKVGA